jgi:alpha-1,3-fucosyltransferase
MPYNSYIDVLNFTSPKELAEYIKEVASDENKYNSYFEWKKEYKSVDTNWDYFCDLCQKLNQTPFNAKSVKSGLLSWWYQQAHCRSPNIKV